MRPTLNTSSWRGRFAESNGGSRIIPNGRCCGKGPDVRCGLLTCRIIKAILYVRTVDKSIHAYAADDVFSDSMREPQAIMSDTGNASPPLLVPSSVFAKALANMIERGVGFRTNTLLSDLATFGGSDFDIILSPKTSNTVALSVLEVSIILCLCLLISQSPQSMDSSKKKSTHVLRPVLDSLFVAFPFAVWQDAFILTSTGPKKGMDMAMLGVNAGKAFVSTCCLDTLRDKTPKLVFSSFVNICHGHKKPIKHLQRNTSGKLWASCNESEVTFWVYNGRTKACESLAIVYVPALLAFHVMHASSKNDPFGVVISSKLVSLYNSKSGELLHEVPHALDTVSAAFIWSVDSTRGSRVVLIDTEAKHFMIWKINDEKYSKIDFETEGTFDPGDGNVSVTPCDPMGWDNTLSENLSQEIFTSIDQSGTLKGWSIVVPVGEVTPKLVQVSSFETSIKNPHKALATTSKKVAIGMFCGLLHAYPLQLTHLEGNSRFSTLGRQSSSSKESSSFNSKRSSFKIWIGHGPMSIIPS